MIKVQVRPNEPLEAALRRFKRQCNYAGIFRLAKKYSFYEKRSDRRRREERERIRNIQRAMRKMADRGRTRSRRKSKIRGGQTSREDSRDEMSSVSGVSAVVDAPKAKPEPTTDPARPTPAAPAPERSAPRAPAETSAAPAEAATSRNAES